MGNDLSIQEIRPMEDVVAAAVATERFALQLVGLVRRRGAGAGADRRLRRDLLHGQPPLARDRDPVGDRRRPGRNSPLLLGQAADRSLAGLIVGGLRPPR